MAEEGQRTITANSYKSASRELLTPDELAGFSFSLSAPRRDGTCHTTLRHGVLVIPHSMGCFGHSALDAESKNTRAGNTLLRHLPGPRIGVRGDTTRHTAPRRGIQKYRHNRFYFRQFKVQYIAAFSSEFCIFVDNRRFDSKNVFSKHLIRKEKLLVNRKIFLSK